MSPVNYGVLIALADKIKVDLANYVRALFESVPKPRDGLDGSQGIPGITGPQGPRGLTGEQGVSVNVLGSKDTVSELPLIGTLGDGWIVKETGNLWFWSPSSTRWEDLGKIAGPQGAAGEQGPVGEQGPIGITGAQGPIGEPGPIGLTGAQGPIGEPGPKGDRGENGLRGERGEQGPRGDKGDRGEQGMQGPRGDKGDRGEKGPAGKDASDPNLEPFFQKISDQYAKLQSALVAKINMTLLNTAGGGGSSGGGSAKILDNDDVEFKRLSEVTQNAVLIFDSTKKKFVVRDLLDFIQSIQTGVEVQYNRLIDVDGSFTYIGEAVPGTLPSAPLWRIKRVETVGQDINILWASGSADLNKIWDSRLTYSYS